MTTAGNKLDELTAALKAARASSPREPRKRHGAIREAVAANLDDLLALRDQLFTDSEIADIFRAKGFAVTAGTLKTYINALRAQKHGLKRTPKKAGRPRTGKAAPAGNNASDVAPEPTVRGPGRPSDLAMRPAATGSTIPSKGFGHRLDDDV